MNITTLKARASFAEPHVPATPHASIEQIERIRQGDDDATLDFVYTHLASCEVCRARLTEPPRVVSLQQRRLRSVPPWLAIVLPLAAAFALVWSSHARPNLPPTVSLARRSFVATMGDGKTTPNTSPEERDLELSFTAPTSLSAALVPLRGDQCMPPRAFERTADRLSLAVAPRNLPPTALLLVGEPHALEQLLAHAHTASTLEHEAERAGVRAQRVSLAP